MATVLNVDKREKRKEEEKREKMEQRQKQKKEIRKRKEVEDQKKAERKRERELARKEKEKIKQSRGIKSKQAAQSATHSGSKSSNDECVCPTCNDTYREDSEENDSEIWIECECCGRWYHLNCAGVQEDDDFICELCCS